MTPSYCQENCPPAGCAECPRPHLLPGAELAVMAYGSVATQWRVSASGLRVGLDYGACLPVLERRLEKWQAAGDLGSAAEDIDVTDLLDDVQMIEFGVLSAQSDRLDQEREKAEANRPGAGH